MILLPAAGDNAAIATRRLEAGERFPLGARAITIASPILEGHRVAGEKIKKGEAILSWGLPFARALRDVEAGEYLCNARILEILRQRHVNFEPPGEPNFENRRLEFEFDETEFKAGVQTPLHAELGFFEGFMRTDGRGAGTRNYVVVLATSSRANSVARVVAGAFADVRKEFPNLDGVVAVTHTEGGGPRRPNNFEMVVRTLNGFLRNPNVAAFVAIDEGDEPVNNRVLQVFNPPGAFISINGDFADAVRRGVKAVRLFLAQAAACTRAKVPLSHLKIGLQCGGSDAFSGVSGNPLVGWIARELVRHGGSASLAETDELIGAESYILKNVRDLATARKFIDTLARFQERASWHGHSAEGNPGGGNMFRGLYNITIKSIGAALKKSPDTRIDYVIDYAEAMPQPGFYFMDSPGNDLESIAGQVGSGCNLILFSTGNGSITNFPFVPTIKVMTTTRRFEMLQQEMDFNAGRFLDGESMDALGREAFDLTVRVASGERSAGEKGGHAQAQLWRDWRQTGPGADLRAPNLSRQPLKIEGDVLDLKNLTFQGYRTANGWSAGRVNLIVPTSLCSGQVAEMIAAAATRKMKSRCVTLPHTEGCGNSAGDSERLMLRTLAGYAVHPSSARTLMLEHGCEKTHNDAFRELLTSEQIGRLGWASIQLDGGIESVTRRAVAWFEEGGDSKKREAAPVSALRVGFISAGGHLPETVMLAARSLAAAGALVVLPETEVAATIDYGEPAPSHGLHGMRTPTEHFVEALTGLGATGVEVIVAWTPDAPVQGHPLVPVFQVGPKGADLKTNSAHRIIELIVRAASGEISPALAAGHADFQITRGPEGVSL